MFLRAGLLLMAPLLVAARPVSMTVEVDGAACGSGGLLVIAQNVGPRDNSQSQMNRAALEACPSGYTIDFTDVQHWAGKIVQWGISCGKPAKRPISKPSVRHTC